MSMVNDQPGHKLDKKKLVKRMKKCLASITIGKKSKLKLCQVTISNQY